jgi:hypothetical protein
MSDGLYQVTTPYLCAGFVVEGGVVTRYAPILRLKFHYWKTIAVRVEEKPSHEHVFKGNRCTICGERIYPP